MVARTAAILLPALLLVGTARPSRAQAAAQEYQVKAAFLLHFAQFVDWPPDVLGSGNQPLNLCLLENEPHRPEIQSTVDGKFIGARGFHFRLLHREQDFQGCNIVFLGREQARHQAAILKSLRSLPILTVGETDNFLSDGGVIRFHLEADRIRFDVDLAAAESVHLKISSRLLLLASTVRRNDAGSPGAR